MAPRDQHSVELLHRERLAEAQMERQAVGAARKGWVKDPGPVPEQSSPARDALQSAATFVAFVLFFIESIRRGGWELWVGMALVAGVVAVSAVPLGRRLRHRLRERREARENSLGI